MINNNIYFVNFFIVAFYITLTFSTTTVPPNQEECWWTGCQLKTWAVTGCDQYNRTQKNIRVCTDGSEYYCCSKSEKPVEDCWWTGCQLNTWAVKGCKSYNRTEREKIECEEGFKYKCCESTFYEDNLNPNYLDEACWWSGCQPKNWSDRGCPLNTIQIHSDACLNGDLFQCCVRKNSSSTNGIDSDEEDIETISGTSFTDYVKYLLLKSNNFSITPDKLRCDLIDVDKSHVFRIKNEGIRVCDLCPYFPQHKYQNIYLDTDPIGVRENLNFPDCFGLCFDSSSCMAFSYDHSAKKCYTFASTDGNLEEGDRWTTVFMTQPTGVLFDWMYSRHTSAVGSVHLNKTQENTFLNCLNKCNMQPECNIVSYSLMNSMCTTYHDIENNLKRVDFEYGYISAFRMSILPISNNEKWRFIETGDYGVLFLKSIKIKDEPCSIKNDSHNSFYSKSCLTTPSEGCDVKTGCKVCYYPEKAIGPENLSICPDSEIYFLEKIEKLINNEMNQCLKNINCMGFGFNSEQTEVITIENFGQRQYSKSFMLKYPKQNTEGIHRYLKKYEFIENLVINYIPNTKTGIQSLTNVSFDECLLNYEKSNYKRMSYIKNEKKCVLSSEFVELIETKNAVTLFKNPTFLSSTLNYIRTPGLRLDSKFLIKKTNCTTNCEETCANTCNQPHNDWCAYVSIEYFGNSAKCNFFNSNETNLRIEVSANSMILVAQSKPNFTLAALDQVNPFSEDENMVLGCFSGTREQTQTSLTVYENPSETTSVAIRRKRGFFDWIGKAVKTVAKTVVNVVKETVNEVVDTAKGVAKAVGKVVKGDLNGAKNAITNIPIVKDIKNAVEFGGAVISGNWDDAKEKGIDLLGSSLLDVGLTVIAPGVGKVIGTGLKSIAKGSKAAIKNTKKLSSNGRSKITQKNNNLDKENNGKLKNKNKDEKDNIDRCESRHTRATTKRGKYGCKRAECDAPKGVRFSLKNTFQRCNRKQVGSKCHYECKVGYEEKGPSATCIKKTNQMSLWDPKPECTLDKCDDSKFPVIAVRTPKVESLTSISTSKYIVVYVVMFDKSRKLPVWSVALHQSDQFQSKSYNDAKDFGRKSFFRYPCTAILNHQTLSTDYSNSGWDQGHLTPANIARWSEKASKSTFSFINIAPQVPYINEHPWKKLEFHVECFGTKHRTIVVTGICKESLSSKFGKQNVDVPKCFWKMICYKDENSIERVVGFVADNSPIKAGTLANREEDIFTARSQSDIEKLYDVTLGSPWIKSIDATSGRQVGINSGFSNDANSGTIWLPVNIYDCMKAKELDEYEKKEWEKKLMKKKSKRKREISNRFSRGCTPSELKEKEEFFDLIKKRQVITGEDTDDEDSDSDDEKSPNGNVEVSVQNCGKRIVGYYTSWGLKKIKSNVLARLTHVIYAFLEIRSDGTIDLGSPDVAHSVDVEEETKKSRNRLEHLMNLAKFYPHLKIMFAVGGWENSQYFSKIAASSHSRVKFIASIIKLIEKYGFDGVDIDWEYPVTGGAVEGIPQDKSNYVLLMKDLRQALDVFANDAGRKNKFLISFAGAAGQWTLDPGFDLPGLLQYADFVNVMTYDFFGAWSSKWGAYTGPPAPLFFGMPPRFSGKTNVDWTIKYYTCKSKQPHKINMGIPFYGGFWNNVGDSVDGKDQMWRMANSVNGIFQGGYTPWFKIQEEHLSDKRFIQSFHEKSKSPYAWNSDTRVFLGYENQKSLEFKTKYATNKNVGGLMIWSVDLDDDDLTLLNTVYNAPLCDKTNPDEVNHKCSPIDEKRWWTSEDGDDMAGLCGRSAPLYKGYYPVCDPDDPGYSCCGPSGYCGSGEKYCDCPTCKDYGNNPKIILNEPIKPTVSVTWYFLNAKEGLRGRCGRKIPKINSVFPTCNPDDENAYCCSNGNYCGKGADFCDCQGCVNFKKTPSYRFGPKKWWTLEDGDKKAGTCGPKADKVDGVYEAECEPNTKFNCCSPNGYCGSGPDYCNCKGCKRF